MKRFNKIAALTMAVVMGVGLTACTTPNGDDGESTPQNGNSDVVYIRVGDRITDRSGANLLTYNRQKAFDEAYPNIKVEHVANPVTDSMKTVQNIVDNSGNADNVCTIWQTTAANYSRSIYQMGLSEDWTPYLSQKTLSSFRDDVIEGLTSTSGALTGFPTALETPLLGFNRKHLRSEYVRKQLLGDEHYNDADAEAQIDAILDNIKTWAQFKEVAAKLTGKYEVDYNTVDVSGYAGYYTDYYLGIGIWFITNGYGVSTQNADGTISVDLTEKSTVETIEFLQSLAEEDITKLNTQAGFDEFFNAIFLNKVASFIYYPTWSSWFQGKAMYASDIKVIELPYGPSVEELKTKKANGENVEVPNTNPSFTINQILNKKATEAQKKAAATYLEFMYTGEATEELIEYRLDEDIESFSMPPFKYTDEYITGTLLSTAPASWSNTIVKALKSLYVLKCDTDSWRTYLSGMTSVMIQKGTQYKGSALIDKLSSLNTTLKNEWLDYYNQTNKR